MAGERVPIPSYGHPRPPAGGAPPWLRFALALPSYFIVLWLVIIPSYPLPLVMKGGSGFFLAGVAAGLIAVRHGSFAGLLGFLLVLLIALTAAGVTLGSPLLGPALLVNTHTANGNPAAVGNVRGDLLRGLLRLAAGAALLSALGGGVGGLLRARSAGPQPPEP